MARTVEVRLRMAKTALQGLPESFGVWRVETMSEDVVPIRRALLSVSDKQGLVELARGPRRTRASNCWPAAVRVRRWSPRPRSDRGRRLHRPARGARRPGQDAPSQDPRRHPRPPRRPRRPGHAGSTGVPDRSTWWSSTSIPSRRRSRGPTPRWPRRSRTSTSAARP